MTDTAQEQHIEDVVADLDDGSLLISVANGRASMSTQMWNRMVEEIARLRARQREGEQYEVLAPSSGGDAVRHHLEDPEYARRTLCGRSAADWAATGESVTLSEADERGFCVTCRKAAAPQREGGREPDDGYLSKAQINALDQYGRVVEIVADRMPLDATFDPASVAGHLLQLLDATPQREGEREPVAWRWRTKRDDLEWAYHNGPPFSGDPPDKVEVQPLYTEPPAERDPTRRDLFRALLGLWRTADGCPHCCNRREVEDAFNVLVRGRSAGLAEPASGRREREPRDDEWPNEPYERQVP